MTAPTEKELQALLEQLHQQHEETLAQLQQVTTEAAQLRLQNTSLATDNDILRLRIERLHRELDGTRRMVLQ